jgi:hypothetical protein
LRLGNHLAGVNRDISRWCRFQAGILDDLDFGHDRRVHPRDFREIALELAGNAGHQCAVSLSVQQRYPPGSPRQGRRIITGTRSSSKPGVAVGTQRSGIVKQIDDLRKENPGPKLVKAMRGG